MHCAARTTGGRSNRQRTAEAKSDSKSLYVSGSVMTNAGNLSVHVAAIPDSICDHQMCFKQWQ